MIRQRLIVLAIAMAAVALGYWGLDALYMTPLRSADARVASLSEQLDALREREVRARQDLAALSNVGEQPTLTLADDRADLAATTARFQEYARTSVAQAGGLTVSSQVAVAELVGGYSKVSVLLRMRFGELEFLQFARQIEIAMPPVIVESLEMRSLPTSGDPRPLDVTATISGFYGNVDAL